MKFYYGIGREKPFLVTVRLYVGSCKYLILFVSQKLLRSGRLYVRKSVKCAV